MSDQGLTIFSCEPLHDESSFPDTSVDIIPLASRQNIAEIKFGLPSVPKRRSGACPQLTIAAAAAPVP